METNALEHVGWIEMTPWNMWKEIITNSTDLEWRYHTWVQNPCQTLPAVCPHQWCKSAAWKKVISLPSWWRHSKAHSWGKSSECSPRRQLGSSVSKPSRVWSIWVRNGGYTKRNVRMSTWKCHLRVQTSTGHGNWATKVVSILISIIWQSGPALNCIEHPT